MKLISLNTWGGIAFESLIDFIKDQAQTTDIFCFQEMLTTSSNVKQFKDVRVNLLNELSNILPDFDYLFTTSISDFYIFGVQRVEELKKVDFDLKFGQVIFYHKSLSVLDRGFKVIYQADPDNWDFLISYFSINLQYLKVEINSKNYTFFNFHGAPWPESKLDSPYRIDQSNKIRDFLTSIKGAKVLVGDFNLMPETKSITILDSVMRNLIKEYKIEKTRSKLNLVNGKPGDQKYADFTFVTENVQVESFEVPDMEISDHLPMILQFSTPLT